MALLVVLLLLAVMVTLATAMTSRYRMLWQQTQNQQIYTQQYWYLRGVESLVKRIIRQDASDSPDKTYRAQYWATENKVIPVDDSIVTGYVRDEQACFNLNSLSMHDETDPSSEATYRAKVFKQLLTELNVEALKAEQVTAAIEDWTDSNSTPQTYGAEDSDYQSLTPPYLAANQLMNDVSELRMVEGIDSQLYTRLLPYVCVLPTTALSIDINTLLPSQSLLLTALSFGEISEDSAQSILSGRPREGWDSVDDFISKNSLSKVSDLSHSLDIKSDYFSSRLTVSNGQQQTKLVSLYYSQNDSVTVIRRHFGETW